MNYYFKHTPQSLWSRLETRWRRQHFYCLFDWNIFINKVYHTQKKNNIKLRSLNDEQKTSILLFITKTMFAFPPSLCLSNACRPVQNKYIAVFFLIQKKFYLNFVPVLKVFIIMRNRRFRKNKSYESYHYRSLFY